MNDDLIKTAKKLVAPHGRGQPRQTDLRRAISTAYYALFHAIAQRNADILVGKGPARLSSAWARVYRSLEHGQAKSVCMEMKSRGFSQPIIDCGNAFVTLQQARHHADYDPAWRTNLTEAEAAIQLAEMAIVALDVTSREEQRDFAGELIMSGRKGR